MVVSCEEVWRELSNYLDGDVEPGLRAAMEEHFRACKHCTAVLDGTRNVIQLYGDERMFEMPLGFSQRLHHRLDEKMPGHRGNAFGWMVAAAATVLIVGSFEAARSSVASRPELRSEHAQPASHVPASMMVVVSSDGKTFHTAGCSFIHHKTKLRAIPVSEALREGYAPCVRCMRKYLSVTVITSPHSQESVAHIAE